MAELISMRKAYAEALVELGAANPNVVVLTADVGTSDFTYLFEQRFPDRYYNAGIAEPCMVDVAAGLALGGKVVFANTFAFLFALRAVEQVRTSLCMTKTNVKLAAAYSGVSDSFDGPTHHCVTDLAIMRSLPNMTVVVASDGVEMKQAVAAVAAWPGPVYLRICRNEVPTLPEHPFQIGKAVELSRGSDVTLIATGIMVARCLEAVNLLAREGISARVLELHTLKPLDVAAIQSAAKETGSIVTAEEHSIVGGLGGAVLEALAETQPVPVVRVGIKDCFAESGPYHPLLERLGLGVSHLVEAACKAVAAKRGP